MPYFSKILLFQTVWLFILVSIFSYQHSIEIIHASKIQPVSKLDSSFQYHFHILDSIAGLGYRDQTLRAQESIYFMEEYTQIDGEADGTFFGKLYFTSNDLMKWKTWYEVNKDSIKGIQ